jgi:protein TonB
MSAVVHGGGTRYGTENRAFRYAILCSVVLHGVLLVALPRFRESAKRAEPPGPIVARLVQRQAAPAQAQPTPPPPVAETTPPAPVSKPSPVSKPAPIAKAQPKAPTPAPSAPSPQPAVPSAPPVEAVPAPPAPPSVATPAPSAPVAKMEPKPAPSAPPTEADAGSLAQYRLQLIGAARRYKRYPRVAMDNNWEGTAEITMVIGANGMISTVLVRTSSGHQVLDQQALEMFKRAKPLVPIPAALQGKEFTVVLRAIYSLKEPDA